MAFKKGINAIQLCFITIGIAIGGQFFGWNYALAHASLVNVLIATLLVGIFYLCFIFCCAELASSMPDAGGPLAFVTQAFGSFAGYLTGIALLCEYGFAIPAIAVATGGYIHFLLPSIPANIASLCAILFCLFSNILGAKNAFYIEMIATALALICLIIFYCIGLHHLPSHFYTNLPLKISLKEIAVATPFLVWIFLAVEGSALTAEEVKNPEKNISRGLCLGMIVLFICAIFTVMILGYHITQTQKIVDYPLAEIFNTWFGHTSIITIIICIISLFGLIAALNGIIIVCSREIYALARAGHIHQIFSKLSKSASPLNAAILTSLVAIICSYSAKLSNSLVTLSVIGGLFMYATTLCAHMKLRFTNGAQRQPFKVWFPITPLIGLLLGVWCIVCILRYLILKESLLILYWHIPLLTVSCFILFIAIIVYHRERFFTLSNS